ncbi:hypothetical protein [Sorangium sp. So ce1389]|uniref:hypothetical protein n=1 Tax=Sorangium sp. So ce1389 TaxID=3133336 RepID=UPI003F5E324D
MTSALATANRAMDFRSIVQYLGAPAKGSGIDVAGAAAVVRGGGILCPESTGAATAFAPRAGARRASAGTAPLGAGAAPRGAGAADGSAEGTRAAVARLVALLSAGVLGVSATGCGAGALDDRSGATGADVALSATGPDGTSRGTNSQ